MMLVPGALLVGPSASSSVKADGPCATGLLHRWFGPCNPPGNIQTMDGGMWYWVRSPDQEKRVVMSLYNRYCIRCHGVDGRGVWDIPDIPNFTNARYQACRTDNELVRYIIEGRGACMPPFRGTLSLEEAWGMAHYLRTFVPGTEVSRPRFESVSDQPAPRPSETATPAPPAPPAPAGGNSRSPFSR
jgi:hypothetical protein